MTKKLGSPKIEKDIRVYIDQRVQIRATFDHGICGECLLFHFLDLNLLPFGLKSSTEENLIKYITLRKQLEVAVF
jgi:hypothetical protein